MRLLSLVLVFVSLTLVRAQPATSDPTTDAPTERPDDASPLPRDAAVQEALRTLDAAGDEDDPLGVGDVASLRDVPVRPPTRDRPEALRVSPDVGDVVAAIPGVRETDHRIDVRWTHGLALVREEIVLRSTADHVSEARVRLPRPEGAWLVSVNACVEERCVSAVPDASLRYDAAWIHAALAPPPEASNDTRNDPTTRHESTQGNRASNPSTRHESTQGNDASNPSPRDDATTRDDSDVRDTLLAADTHVDARGPAFSIHVAPLEPGRTRTLRVVWAAPLSILGGVARLTIPSRGNDLRATAARVSFDPGDVLAPTLQRSPSNAALEVDPWTPIELSGRLPSGALRTSAVPFACGRARCVHAHLAAGSREGPRERVVLLLDVSPSSFGPARGRLAPALTSLLAALPPGSEVRAWAFAARAEALVDTPSAPTEIPFAALAGAASHELGASTRLDVALRALGEARDTHVIVIGDGGLTEGPHLDAAIAEAARKDTRLSVLSLVDRPVHARLASAVERLGGRQLRLSSSLFEARSAASLDGLVATLFAPSLGTVQLGRSRLGELRAGEALHHIGVLPRGASVHLGRLTVPLRPTIDAALRDALAALGRAHAGEPTRLAYVPNAVSNAAASNAAASNAAASNAAASNAEASNAAASNAAASNAAATCESLVRLANAPTTRVDPWMSADTRSCALPVVPPSPPSTLGHGIPAETVLSMLRRRVVPVARGCFRRDRAGREDYATRAVFELRLTDREVAAADVIGAIDDELRECLLNAVDGLDVPAYDGTIVVRYPLFTRASGPALTIELHPDVANVVDRVLPTDAPSRPSL